MRALEQDEDEVIFRLTPWADYWEVVWWSGVFGLQPVIWSMRLVPRVWVT